MLVGCGGGCRLGGVSFRNIFKVEATDLLIDCIWGVREGAQDDPEVGLLMATVGCMASQVDDGRSA